MSRISYVNLAILIFSILVFDISHADNINSTLSNNSTQEAPPPTFPPFTEESIKVKEPLALFFTWFNEALKKRDPDSFVAYLATVNKAGYPSQRILSLSDINDKGFLFSTNHNSREAKDIAENPNVAMTLFWKTLQRVVHIEGVAEKLAEEDSMKIFRQKPRASQIRYLASSTSSRVPSREYLREVEADIKANLAPNDTVPFPNWGGYIIIPNSIEFLQAQSDFINDRIRFRRGEDVEKEVDGKLVHLGENGWIYERLAP